VEKSSFAVSINSFMVYYTNMHNVSSKTLLSMITNCLKSMAEFSLGCRLCDDFFNLYYKE